ncbi:phosphate transporter [Priestia taiwanensis]|nr:phosphate transporter [Priestia taiwanensis]MBM7364108.1 hypothetical protein [Priestia taiwanensis]
MEKYEKKKQHSIIISTNNAFNEEEGSYEIIMNTISKVVHFLDQEFSLYEYHKCRSKVSLPFYVEEKGIFTNKIIGFWPLHPSEVDKEVVSDMYIIGDKNIEGFLRDIHERKFDSITELWDYFEDNCAIMCQIYDSAHIEVHSKDIAIITKIDQLIE